MLDELCKRDKEWRKMAFHICKSKVLADDIVQDMYLKFANYKKPINDYYIFFAIKHIFTDYIRKENNIKFIEIDLFPFEVDKKMGEINNDFYDFETDYLKELALTKVKELPYFERELLTVTQEISQRQLARETDISFVVINQTIKKTKKQLWQEIKRIKD
jgi:DNA-directed RNA polymerase specialized sigma24 family protein